MTPVSPQVHDLTRNHKVWITRDNGERELAEEWSLLHELHSIMTGESRGAGDTTSNGGGTVPIALAAVTIWEEIANAADTHWPGRASRTLQRTPLAEKVHAWATYATENAPAEAALLDQAAEDWGQRIRALRVRTSDLKAPCPQCGATHVLVDDEDGSGSQIRKQALCFTTERATCRACTYEWRGLDEMKHLAGLVNAAV